MSPCSSFLSRFETMCPFTPIEAPNGTRGPPSPPSDIAPYPSKRPRSDYLRSGLSSSTATSLSISPSDTEFSLSPVESTSLSAQLHSILTPSSSPAPSRCASRRSSAGASTKSVRFARCTNASVFPALSKDDYDRSPIVPSCEAERLNLPARDCDGTEGWIKCVERARVAEKERVAAAVAAGDAPPNSFKVVEGLHGLVGGGYFVGDEHRETSTVSAVYSSDEEPLDDTDDEGALNCGMVVDDEEEDIDVGESVKASTPPLVHDDSSDDSESVPSVSDAMSPVHVAVSLPILHKEDLSSSSLQKSSPSPATTIVLPAPVGSAGIFPCPIEAVKAAAAVAAELERKRKCRERYGICALGKYTRAEVFQSYDSLGGF